MYATALCLLLFRCLHVWTSLVSGLFMNRCCTDAPIPEFVRRPTGAYTALTGHQTNVPNSTVRGNEEGCTPCPVVLVVCAASVQISGLASCPPREATCSTRDLQSCGHAVLVLLCCQAVLCLQNILTVQGVAFMPVRMSLMVRASFCVRGGPAF